MSATFSCSVIPSTAIEVLGGRIGRVHVKNFMRAEGAGTLEGFTSSLFDGDLNWAAVFEALHQVGYTGYLTAEMLVSDKGIPDNDLAKSVSAEMDELLARFGKTAQKLVLSSTFRLPQEHAEA